MADYRSVMIMLLLRSFEYCGGDVFSTDELRQELDLTGDNWKNAGDPSC